MDRGGKPIAYAFDFDGVISEYHGFQGAEHTGAPIVPVIETMRKLKAMGHKIIIYSTRGEEVMKKFFSEHDVPYDYINENPEHEGGNHGKPIAHVYVDDRGLCYKGQSTEELLDEILNFKAYWQK